MANKNELITKELLEITPSYVEGFTVPKSFKKFPWELVPTLGAAVDSFAGVLQTAIHGTGGSGMYWVDVPKDGKMFAAKDGSGFIGSTSAPDGGVGGGQARLKPIQIDVGQLCNALTLATIQIQLSDIKEQEKAILDYLQVRDEAVMLGNMDFLVETLEGYKLNWNNADYKRSRQNKIVSILADAKGYVKQYKKMADVVIKRKHLIHGNRKVEQQLNDLMQIFTDYKIAISLYSFASYMDVMLHETYSEEYLENILKEINSYIRDYKRKYKNCAKQLKQYAETSLQAYLTKGLVIAQGAVGQATEKIPLLNRTLIEQKRQDGGDILEYIDNDRVKNVMKSFRQCRMPDDNVFASQISMINILHNRPMIMVYDKDCLYVGDALEANIA